MWTGAQLSPHSSTLRSGKAPTVPAPCEPDEVETTVTRAARRS